MRDKRSIPAGFGINYLHFGQIKKFAFLYMTRQERYEARTFNPAISKCQVVPYLIRPKYLG
jgi:hypothetical protein